MIIKDALNLGAQELNGVSSSPALDVEVLLLHVLSSPPFSPSAKREGEIERGWLYANPEYKLTTKQFNKFRKLIRKRARHWPVAYLTGHKEFFGLKFRVTPAVLIPRPETELLVERALELLQTNSYNLQAIIDLGTGSGNIIISPSKTLFGYHRLVYDTSQFFAIDNSSRALAIARLNARRHKVDKKIQFLRGHLLGPILKSEILNLQSAILLANLPYGWKQWKNNTSEETIGLKFEPQQALFTKEGGLYLIHKLFKQLQAIRHPRPRIEYGTSPDRGSSSLDSRLRGNDDIIVLLEMDPRQKPALQALAKKYFPAARLSFHKDLAKRYRVMEIRH